MNLFCVTKDGVFETESGAGIESRDEYLVLGVERQSVVVEDSLSLVPSFGVGVRTSDNSSRNPA